MQKKIRPIANVVIVKPLPKDSFMDDEKKLKLDTMQEIEESIVVSKGAKCSDNYEVGDIVGYVMGQRYIAGEVSFIHDEDVRYVVEK